MRDEVATRLTEELVRNGNRQAIAFRPVVEAGIESVLDTDTFRAIFRGAVRTADADLLRDGSSGHGLDLSESVAVLSTTLQLSGGGQVDDSSFATTFADVSDRVGSFVVWDLDGTIGLVAVVALLVAGAAAAGAVLLSANRRRTIWWIGWTVAAAGVCTVVVLWVAGRIAARPIHDAGLAGAVRGAIGDMTSDLRTAALWGHRLRRDHRRRRGDGRAPRPGG